MRVRHLPAWEYRRERWQNGAGWTREIHRAPAQGAFDWRVSIAEIEQDCLFSEFPGCERTLLLLGGDGCRLDFGDGRIDYLSGPHGRTRFDGGNAPHCEVQSRLEVFNLIARRDAVDAELLHRPLVGPMVFFDEPRVQWLVHVLRGSAEPKDSPRGPLAEAGDSLLMVPTPDAPERCIITGGGEVLLARIEAA